MSVWSDLAKAMLARLWTQGLSAANIAAAINSQEPGARLSRSAIISKRIRMGLPDRASPSYNAGATVAAVRKKAQAKTLQKPRAQNAPPPLPTDRSPVKSHRAVRFLDRQPDQCPMFCAGEEGPKGFVCGEPTGSESSWCPSCRRIAFQPQGQKEAA